ncbi:MAG: hypothetical protein WCO84_01440 [bacterium]
MLDMTSVDAPLVKQMHTYLNNGDFTNANLTLVQIPSYNQKILTADKWNKMRDALLALERFWLTDIAPYITTKQTEWENIVNLFVFNGIYNPATQYVKNNYVQYTSSGQALLYICTATPPSVGIAPTNTTYWRVITAVGEQGVSGTGVSFLFAWSNGTSYTTQDVVTYENKLWGALQNNIAQPPFDGSANWDILADITPATYPLTSGEPVGQVVGDLWFKVL